MRNKINNIKTCITFPHPFMLNSIRETINTLHGFPNMQLQRRKQGKLWKVIHRKRGMKEVGWRERKARICAHKYIVFFQN